jgi:universal stress protein A
MNAERNILVPVDYSEVSKEMTQFADEWAQRTQAKLHILHASPIPNVEYYPGRLERTSDRDDARELIQLSEFVKDLELKSPHDVMHLHGTPYLKILDAVESVQADLVIMAAHSHTLMGRIFLGSNTDYVVHHSHVPMYVYRKPGPKASKKLVVPIDLSESNKEVLRRADETARREELELQILHVIQTVDYSYFGGEVHWAAGVEITADQAKQAVEDFVMPLNLQSTWQLVIKFGNSTYHPIIEHCEEVQPSLVMMAAHDHSVLGRLFLGSNTDYVLHHTQCPIYVHKENSVMEA